MMMKKMMMMMMMEITQAGGSWGTTNYLVRPRAQPPALESHSPFGFGFGFGFGGLSSPFTTTTTYQFNNRNCRLQRSSALPTSILSSVAKEPLTLSRALLDDDTSSSSGIVWNPLQTARCLEFDTLLPTLNYFLMLFTQSVINKHNFWFLVINVNCEDAEELKSVAEADPSLTLKVGEGWKLFSPPFWWSNLNLNVSISVVCQLQDIEYHVVWLLLSVFSFAPFYYRLWSTPANACVLIFPFSINFSFSILTLPCWMQKRAAEISPDLKGTSVFLVGEFTN